MFELIAVIDEDLDRRTRLYDTLTELNYHVTTLPSSAELLELLKRERPHCAILTTDGFADAIVTTLRAIRKVDQQLKVIALVPPALTEGEAGRALVSDSRVRLVSTDLDQAAQLRAVLNILKEREIERVPSPTAFQGHVLVVEDDPGIAQMIARNLESRGYRLAVVSNGEEALVQMRIERPKVVLLDLMLPGMDGLVALQRLKAIDPTAIIIVISGLEDEGLKRQALSLGAAAFFAKPFDLAALEATMLTSLLPKSTA